MLCYCDYEQPSFYRAVERTAAKPHRCCECGGTIQSGEKYEYVSGKWDGRPESFRTCEACADLRDSLAADSGCFQHGGLFEEYYEYLLSILQHIDKALTVCDPFMGTGTTGVACAQLGKAFTGIERERKFFDIACERIAWAQAQGQLLPPEQKPAAVQEALL